VLHQAAQGSGGVPIPRGVQKMCRCGTAGHGLAGRVVLGVRLALTILEVFSNLNDSMNKLHSSGERVSIKQGLTIFGREDFRQAKGARI